MRIFFVTGAIVLLVGTVLLVSGLAAYGSWLECETIHCGVPTSFDDSYLITGLVITTTGVITLVIGLKKKI